MNRFPAATAISEVDQPLSWTPDKQKLMVDACREMALFHAESNPVIQKLYAARGFDPNSLQTENDLANIPALGVTAMKRHLLTSLPEEQAVLKLTSSGTRGLKTQIWFDEDSLARVQRMLDVTLGQEGLVSQETTNYLVFAYDPKDAGNLGIAYTEKNQLRFAPANEVYYAVHKPKNKDGQPSGDWHFSKEECLQTLERYAAEGKPVRLLGMPAFLFEFVEHARKQGVHLNLPRGSLILTGGGWKAAEDKSVSRAEFRNRCSDVFGIPDEWIRDGFGMAEHSAPYFECSHHRFHVPAFNRIIPQDPVSLKPTAPGEMGLMHLITPFNAMMPNLSLLATDWVRLLPDPCPCGQNSPTFELLGRAGLSKHKGCALHADDIVKRSQK